MASDFYDMPNFLAGCSSLKSIELALLGDIRGKRVLHLQCHFGQDSISLSRLGAQVTGVDLSDVAIERARTLALHTQSDAQFVCCDVYEAPKYIQDTFDIVFASYGAIGWLPDLHRWAQVIAHFLKPQGQLVFVEFHPVVWMFDDAFEKVGYRYFNTGPIVETQSGTYANPTASIQTSYVMWNHSLSEVFQSLMNNGLAIQAFEEYDYSPYPCFQAPLTQVPQGYRIAHLEDKIPMVYSVVATKTR